MPTVPDAFAALLTMERERAGLTQEQLGQMAGMDRSTVGALERGLSSPLLETVMKLASALEIDTCELIPPMRWRMTPAGPPVGEWAEE
jgi:transcriptional regulator with XRE-family HTH domain